MATPRKPRTRKPANTLPIDLVPVHPKRQPDDGQCEHYEPVQPAEPRNEADQCDEQCHEAEARHDVHGHCRKRGLKVVQCFMAQLVSWLVPRV
jgi:hypothetical protein